MSNASSVAFPYSEKLASETFDIPRSELREARSLHLKRGVDWQKNDGGAVVLSERGLTALLDFAGVGAQSRILINFDTLLAKKNGAAAGPEKLIVVAICPNPRMVLANESGDWNQDRELVDVGNNANFVVGDAIEVEPHGAQKGIWKFVGKHPATRRRLPVQTHDSGALTSGK